jgi:hypothetical protein
MFHQWRGRLGVPSARTGERGALLALSLLWQSAHKLRSRPSLNAVKSPLDDMVGDNRWHDAAWRPLTRLTAITARIWSGFTKAPRLAKCI